MKLSEAFREAKEYISTGQHTFICHALRYGVNTEVAIAATYIVQPRVACAADGTGGVARMPCAERWLASKGFDLTRTEMRQWRIMWLNRLIAEFEAKGE